MASLQQELQQKPDAVQSTKSRKRTFSEIESSPIAGDSSYLKRMYDQFETHSNGGSFGYNVSSMTDSVMTSQDISLQSFGKYESIFVKANPSRVCCISFSSDGSCIGIGGMDGTVRIFDVSKLHQSSNFNLIKKYDSNSYSALHRPVICTLSSSEGANTINPTDSQQTPPDIVYEVDFYPLLNVRKHVVSCFDGGIHLFDFSSKSRKVPLLTVNECFTVRTVQYHPGGQFVLAGGQSAYVRLYDVQKEQGFIAKHGDRDDYDINQIRWGLNGNVFVSCSQRGDIRLYDGRTMATVNTLRAPHCGKNVTSVRFNTDCKYLLSSGYALCIYDIDVF